MTPRREKVAIGIPYYRTAEGPTLLCAMEMAAYSSQFIDMLPIGSSGAYVEQNRNGIVQYAMNTGIEFDWLFWMDTDMIFPPDTLLRLIAHDKDIIGCNYRTRTPPYLYTGHYLDERGNDSLDLENVFRPGVVQMSQLPTGLLLTRFSVYQRPEWNGIWFDASTRGPRDDIYFCRFAKSLGYTIWCEQDLTAKVRHRDIQEIPWFQPDQIKTQRGAGLMIDSGLDDAKERAAKSATAFKEMSDKSVA